MKFKTIEELQKKIDAYFNKCKKEKRPLTITGLALELDTTRETLIDYQNRDEFSDTIKRAKLRVEQYAEEMLYKIRPAGPIFALKNFNWKDENTTKVVLPKPIDDLSQDDSIQEDKANESQGKGNTRGNIGEQNNIDSNLSNSPSPE